MNYSGVESANSPGGAVALFRFRWNWISLLEENYETLKKIKNTISFVLKKRKPKKEEEIVSKGSEPANFFFGFGEVRDGLCSNITLCLLFSLLIEWSAHTSAGCAPLAANKHTRSAVLSIRLWPFEGSRNRDRAVLPGPAVCVPYATHWHTIESANCERHTVR